MPQLLTTFLALLMAVSFSMSKLPPPSGQPTPMAATRADPYKNFKFRVKMDGRTVAGFSRIIGLQWPPARSPSPPALSLQQGVTRDAAFGHWANAMSRRSPNARWQADKKTLAIETLNEAGHVEKTYTVSHASVSKYQGVPNLNANANEVTIQVLDLEHEGLIVN